MKPSRIRRQVAVALAREKIYSSKGRIYTDSENPFKTDSIQHSQFKHEYELAHKRYWRCESMLREMEDVYGTYNQDKQTI